MEEVDEATLMQAWDSIPKDDRNTLDVTTASLIVNNLFFLGEDKLTPLLERLGDAAVPANEKVLIVISMEPYVRPSMGEALLSMTAPGKETTTRACATHLYGRLDMPDVEANLLRLSEDSERRVRMAALFVRQLRGDATALAPLKEASYDSESQASEREQFVLSLPEAFAAENLDVFLLAVKDPELSFQAQERSLNLIEQLGGAESIEALKLALETEALHESLRERAGTILDSIQKRTDAAAPAEETPAAA